MKSLLNVEDNQPIRAHKKVKQAQIKRKLIL